MKSAILLLSLSIICVSSQSYQNGRQNSPSQFFPKAASLLCGLAGKTATAVDKIMKDKKPITYEVTEQCGKQAIAGAVIYPGGTVKRFPIRESCELSNLKSNNAKVILHGVGESSSDISNCGSPRDPQFLALYLAQLDDFATYTILDPEKATWIFTTDLSGCDIFIATNDLQPKSPLVIHANANSITGAARKVENLTWKAQRAQEIERAHNGYHVKARLMISPDPRKPVPAGFNEYVKLVKDSGVTPYLYDIDTPVLQPILFFGHYNGKSWEFITKGKKNGVIKKIKIL